MVFGANSVRPILPTEQGKTPKFRGKGVLPSTRSCFVIGCCTKPCVANKNNMYKRGVHKHTSKDNKQTEHGSQKSVQEVHGEGRQIDHNKGAQF